MREMPPEHPDTGGSCSVPPDEIFTISPGSASEPPVEPTFVRPGLWVATGIRLPRRWEMRIRVGTGNSGIKQRVLRMTNRGLVLFSLCKRCPRVDDVTSALIFETKPCANCEEHSPCERESPCEGKWFRLIPKRPQRARNPSRARRCPLCVVALPTFQYHLQFSGASSTLVPCSHAWGEDVMERLTKCRHWSGADKHLFLSHATAALAGEMRMDWSCSAQEYRCCLGIVIEKVVEDGGGCRASQFWLMMWAAFALISLYNLRLPDFDKYFEVSNVVSEVLECHLRTSLSYFTKGRKTCMKRLLEVKGVLRKTLADLQADCNRVRFVHGLTEEATMSGTSERELCRQLCDQHARAENYEDFFHWKKKLKELVGDSWKQYIEAFTYDRLLMDFGHDNRTKPWLFPGYKLEMCFSPQVAGLASGELDSTLNDAEALYERGEVRKAFECVMVLKQKLEVSRSCTTNRSVFLAFFSCQSRLIRWVTLEEAKLNEERGSSWLEKFFEEDRYLMDIGFTVHFKEYLIIDWALGYRSNSVAYFHFQSTVLLDRESMTLFQVIQTMYPELCEHKWDADTIAFRTARIRSLFSAFAKVWLTTMREAKVVALLTGKTLFSLRDVHHKVDPRSGLFMTIAEISRVIQCLIYYQQQVKDMMPKLCKRINLEPNRAKLRKVLEYGNASSNVAGISSSREAFLWGERTLQSSLLYQLPRIRSCADSQKELHKFYHDDDFAWEVLKEAQELCGPGAVVIAYQFVDNTTMFVTYVLRHNQEVVMRVHDKELEADETRCLKKQVTDAIERIYAALNGSKGGDALIEPLGFLHSILYDPISDLLGDCAPDRKLIIIPGRHLTDVPFPLLYSTRLQQHLFERHVVSLSHSLQVIKHLDNMHNHLHGCSLLNKHMMGTTITDTALQGGAAEAAMLVDLFGRKNVTRLVKAEVTVTDVLDQATLPSRKRCYQAFLHFTTHGDVNSEKYPSGVLHVAKAVSDEDSSDVEDCGDTASGVHDGDEESGGVDIKKADLRLGVLTSEQIVRIGMDLRTFVAVLAACNSARGTEYPGQGLLNLPRAFMIAGVPSVVGSQYLESDDKSTPYLMSLFYKHLINGEDVATSLCKSMRLMNDRGYKLNQLGAFVVWGLPTCKLPEHIRKVIKLSSFAEKIWTPTRNDTTKSNVWVPKCKI